MEYMESKMQDYIEAGINERERCYNEIVELEHLRDKYKELYESSMLSEATAKQYAEEVDKQNKELAAQVEALRGAICKYPTVEIPLVYKALLATPQHHLAELRAAAGRAGFVAGANWWARCELCDDLHLDENNAANHYADKIRQEVK